MRFQDIEGQRDVINHLTEIADMGRVSHAQLFAGDDAAHMFRLAMAYVQYLGCQNKKHYDNPHDGLRADSCGECPNCKKYAQLMHPDLHLVFPTVTTEEVKSSPSSQDFQEQFRTFMLQTHLAGTYDEWCQYLEVGNKQGEIRERDADYMTEVLQLKSYEGGYKILLLWMAEKMNTVAANTLLKSLEEPSDKTLFLLLTPNEERLLKTVLSRVQMWRIPSPKSQVSSRETDRYAETFVQWMRQLFKLNMQTLTAWADAMHQQGREAQKRFLLYAQDSVRACFMCNVAGVPLDRTFHDEKFDKSFPAMITGNNVEGLCQAFDEAIYAIDRNAFAKLTFIELSFRVSKALKRR